MNCLLKFRKYSLVLLFLITCNLTFSQVFDDFSDGDFIFNPEWKGDTSQFNITNSSAIPAEMKPALQLDGIESDTTYLYLENSAFSNSEWQFWIKLSFNTSANNFARVYLVSDQANLESALNGYFIQIGGANDSIGLFRQNGINLEKIISSTNAFTGNSTNVLRIKVTRNAENNWSLYSDVNGGYNFGLEGTAIDNTFLTTQYFGIFCKYTSSNSSKFYFDDFYVNEIIIDTVPPVITNIEVISPTEVDIHFNESVEINSAQEITNYLIENLGNPLTAIRDQQNYSLVHLDFQQPLLPGINYSLTVSNVLDLSENLMLPEVHTVTLEEVSSINPYEIVINEIMVDVNPIPANLPEADFIELHNTTNHIINLENCTLKPKSSSDPILFPAVNIEPDGYLIVVHTSDVELFSQYGFVVGLPGFSLNNEGEIVLRNQQGNLIQAIFYTKEWYQDELKEEGGWSIEQIDPAQPCIGQENWKASINGNGGTPGFQNSIAETLFSIPEIISVQTMSDNSLQIRFSHFMDSLNLTNVFAYEVDQGIGFPESAILDELHFNYVALEFASSFMENNNYQLTIKDTLYNCAGNYIDINSTYNFMLPVPGQPFDIVINEIMADPDPPGGLPEFEYVELYNTTSSYIQMNGWKLIIGSSEKQLPDIILEPNEYIIITVDEAADLFGMLTRSFGFSGLGLTNSGTSIKLLNEEDILMSSVNYNDDWYLDAEKEEGGWSLEQIDPENPCPGKENWRASNDERGGSPGIINSVDAINMIAPGLQKVIPINTNTIEILFNQMMDNSSLSTLTNYEINFGIGNPYQVFLDPFNEKKITIKLSDELNYRTIYSLKLSEEIKSCIGLSVPVNYQMEFGLAENAVKGDIVINEILFNPIDDGVDFVEIYNNSDKIIDLKDLQLGTIDINQFSPNDTLYKVVSEENSLFLKDNFLVLTKNSSIVKDQYFTKNPENFLDMNSFPSYNNEQGSIVLSGVNDLVVDAFNYYEEMHHPLLNSIDGVSLERINYNRPTYDNTNWHSASSEVGFATPGYENSQHIDDQEINDEVYVEPEIFSPDNDGYNDVLNIHYKFENPGYTANIQIFDAQGRLTKYLIRSSILGTEGTFSWDGRTEDNRKALIGIYIVYFEAFDINGNIKKYKKSAVLGGKL